MEYRLWGVRGSIPTPVTSETVEEKIRAALTLATPGDITSDEAIDSFIASLPFSVRGTYGGNTTCITVTTDDGDLFIIDGGSGLKNLGKELLKGEFGRGQGKAHFLFTHTHWDHVQGIPFFVPLYIGGNRFTFYSPLSDLKERLEYQQVQTHFPVPFSYFSSDQHFVTINNDEAFYLHNTRITTKMMPHPGGAYGYRIEHNGSVFVYTSDCEFNIESIDQIDKYEEFFSDADVVIFDTQYTFDEAISKMDYGHSSASIAIDIACRFNCKKLLLFHHEPDYPDGKIESVLSNARAYQKIRRNQECDVEIAIAYEGLTGTV